MTHIISYAAIEKRQKDTTNLHAGAVDNCVRSTLGDQTVTTWSVDR